MLSMTEDPRLRARDIRAKFFPRPATPVAAVRRGAHLPPVPLPKPVDPVTGLPPPPEPVEPFDPDVIKALTDRGKARAIIADTCRRHRVPVEDLFAQIRTQRMVEIRAEACWLIRHHTKLSTTQMGRILKRDHSSIVYLIQRKVKDWGPAR